MLVISNERLHEQATDSLEVTARDVNVGFEFCDERHHDKCTTMSYTPLLQLERGMIPNVYSIRGPGDRCCSSERR